MKKIISLQLEDTVIEQLKLICKQQDRSMSSLCGMAIIRLLEENKSVGE